MGESRGQKTKNRHAKRVADVWSIYQKRGVWRSPNVKNAEQTIDSKDKHLNASKGAEKTPRKTIRTEKTLEGRENRLVRKKPL